MMTIQFSSIHFLFEIFYANLHNARGIFLCDLGGFSLRTLREEFLAKSAKGSQRKRKDETPNTDTQKVFLVAR